MENWTGRFASRQRRISAKRLAASPCSPRSSSPIINILFSITPIIYTLNGLLTTEIDQNPSFFCLFLTIWPSATNAPGTFSMGEPSSRSISSSDPSGSPAITSRLRMALFGQTTPRRSSCSGNVPFRASGKGRIFVFSQKSAISRANLAGESNHFPIGKSGKPIARILARASSGVMEIKFSRRNHSEQAKETSFRKASSKPGFPF